MAKIIKLCFISPLIPLYITNQTEEQFQSRLSRKINQNQLLREVACNNRARSFMNFYQQHAEYEARLKVRRMDKDLWLANNLQSELVEQVRAMKGQGIRG